MPTTKSVLAAASVLGAVALTVVTAAPAQARPVDPEAACITGDPHDHGSAARGGYGPDHREVTPKEQRAIARATEARLREKGITRAEAAATSATVPVYVHVMAAADGTGDVTAAQITQQIAVLNKTFAGGESRDAADMGFSFTLAGVDRYYNDAWHQDRSSAKYRKLTRQGGANALNIWLVDFKYLSIATFRGTTTGTAPSTASGSTTTPCRAATSPTTTWGRPRPTRSATGSGCTTPSRAGAPS